MAQVLIVVVKELEKTRLLDVVSLVPYMDARVKVQVVVGNVGQGLAALVAVALADLD